MLACDGIWDVMSSQVAMQAGCGLSVESSFDVLCFDVDHLRFEVAADNLSLQHPP